MKLRTILALVVAFVIAEIVFQLTNCDGTTDAEDPDGNSDFDLYGNTIGAISAMVSAQAGSANGQAFTKGFEGCKLTAYPDHQGYSIGWGHNGASAGQTCTQAQADAWFASDYAAAGKTVSKFVRVALNQDQFDALTDFAYEFGSSKFGGSTLVKLLNAGNYGAVPAQLSRWVYALVEGVETQLDELVTRRNAEIELWGVSSVSGGSGDGDDDGTEGGDGTDGNDSGGSDSSDPFDGTGDSSDGGDGDDSEDDGGDD